MALAAIACSASPRVVSDVTDLHVTRVVGALDTADGPDLALWVDAVFENGNQPKTLRALRAVIPTPRGESAELSVPLAVHPDFDRHLAPYDVRATTLVFAGDLRWSAPPDCGVPLDVRIEDDTSMSATASLVIACHP